MGQRLGQHFLVDEDVRDAIVAAVHPVAGERVLEIGPGRGVLTEPLLRSGAAITAVELDDRLNAKLSETLVPQGLDLLHADFLSLDLGKLRVPCKVVGNLPYSVGAPILQRLLAWDGWTIAVLMFQKEVALRVASEPGGADYGLLTLSVRLRAEAEYLLEAPPRAFRPPPKVSSGVVRLTRRAQPLVAPERQAAFFRLAKAAFAQRRKMAAGVIASALRLPRERVALAMAGLGAAPTARPEELPLETFRALAEELLP